MFLLLVVRTRTCLFACSRKLSSLPFHFSIVFRFRWKYRFTSFAQEKYLTLSSCLTQMLLFCCCCCCYGCCRIAQYYLSPSGQQQQQRGEKFFLRLLSNGKVEIFFERTLLFSPIDVDDFVLWNQCYIVITTLPKTLDRFLHFCIQNGLAFWTMSCQRCRPGRRIRRCVARP